MENIFTKHPRSVGETYLQHFFAASKIGAKMLLGGIAALLHAGFPFLFLHTARSTVHDLSKTFQTRPMGDEQDQGQP